MTDVPPPPKPVPTAPSRNGTAPARNNDSATRRSLPATPAPTPEQVTDLAQKVKEALRDEAKKALECARTLPAAPTPSGGFRTSAAPFETTAIRRLRALRDQRRKK